MRVHPVRSAETQREIVVGAAPRRYGRSGDAGDAVLLPGRRKAVPVDQARFVDAIDQPELEAFVRPQESVAARPDVASPPRAVALARPGREQLGDDLLVVRRQPLVVLEDALVFARDHPLAGMEHERPEAADRARVARLQDDSAH